MKDIIKENIEKIAKLGEKRDIRLTDGEIICYMLENAELSFPENRSFSFNINTPWHLDGISRKRADDFALGNSEQELFKKTKAYAFSAYPDWGHTSTSWDEVLMLGISGLSERVFKYEKDATENKEYYSGLAKIYRAVISFVKRAAKEAVLHGKEKLSAALFSLAERAPETLFEALVTILLYYNLHQEVECTPLRTVGRLDTLLLPFFEKEKEENAREMLILFMKDLDEIKFSANVPFALGGTDSEGNSLINKLSYLILDAFEAVSSANVKLHLLTSKNTPDKFLRRAFEIIRGGYNSIVFLSDETVIKSLVRIGISQKDARAYHVVGCYECLGDGEIGSTCAATVNIQKAVEYALFDGFDNLLGKQIGIHSNSEAKGFEEFFEEFERQLVYITECAMRVNDLYEAVFDKIHSSPIYTSAAEKTLASGKDVFGGGAKYKNTSLNAIGLATAVDSLAAIKRTVFDEGIISLSSLSSILLKNWQDNEKLRLYAKRKCPKFGSANSQVDAIAKRIIDLLDKTVNGKPNKTNGVYRLGTFSIDWRWEWGEHTLASADGRLCGETLSQNTGASFGVDLEGVSAHLLSVARLNGERTPNGSIVDIDLHSSALSGEGGLSAAVGSLRAYFAEGGFAVHYNVLNKEALKEAKENPDKYPNLQIRKCGWNVRFSSLSEKEKDELISLSER